MEQYIIKGGNPLVGEVEIGVRMFLGLREHEMRSNLWYYSDGSSLWDGLYYRGKWSIRACSWDRLLNIDRHKPK